MEQQTISRIEQRLRHLSPENLSAVLDFVTHLLDRQGASEALETMLASEALLRRDWDTSEEDEAWADL
jgi:hypothetical protein